ncbi:hypothetical protein JW711_01805 [Candidatus Woesearchaeota archaeon]|nr:hypothetical protein [Candidatus Woesearchaeota archaeon]
MNKTLAAMMTLGALTLCSYANRPKPSEREADLHQQVVEYKAQVADLKQRLEDAESDFRIRIDTCPPKEPAESKEDSVYRPTEEVLREKIRIKNWDVRVQDALTIAALKKSVVEPTRYYLDYTDGNMLALSLLLDDRYDEAKRILEWQVRESKKDSQDHFKFVKTAKPYLPKEVYDTVYIGMALQNKKIDSFLRAYSWQDYQKRLKKRTHQENMYCRNNHPPHVVMGGR